MIRETVSCWSKFGYLPLWHVKEETQPAFHRRMLFCICHRYAAIHLHFFIIIKQFRLDSSVVLAYNIVQIDTYAFVLHNPLSVADIRVCPLFDSLFRLLRLSSPELSPHVILILASRQPALPGYTGLRWRRH